MFLDNDLTNDGTITMDASAPSGYSYLYLEGYTFTNMATFDIPADGNSGYYADVVNGGSFVNTGTVQVDGDLYVSGDVTFTNGTGGSVVNNGTFTDGTYVQDGGTNSGTPLSPSTLVLSGGGSASFSAQDMSVQGELMAGQSIDIPAGGSMFLDNNLTNDGTITMDASAPSGYSYLYLEGYTLTNAATFDVPADADNDGYYAIVTNSGSIVNTGTVDVDGDLYVEGSVTFTNGTGGSVVNNGMFDDGSGTFTNSPRWLGGQQRAVHRRHLRPRRGVELGHPVVAVDAGSERGRECLVLGPGHERAGRTDGRAVHRHPRGGMFLDNNLTNDGTITMDASAPSGYSYLYLEGYTLTNAATFDVPADADNDGYYAIVTNSGSIVNTGTVDVDGDSTSRQRDVHERHRRLGGEQRDVRRRVRHFHE